MIHIPKRLPTKYDLCVFHLCSFFLPHLILHRIHFYEHHSSVERLMIELVDGILEGSRACHVREIRTLRSLFPSTSFASGILICSMHLSLSFTPSNLITFSIHACRSVPAATDIFQHG